MIDRIRQRFVAVKDVNQKDASILVQSVRNPNCQGDRNYEIQQISGDFDVHNGLPRRIEHVQLLKEYYGDYEMSRTFLNVFRNIALRSEARLGAPPERVGSEMKNWRKLELIKLSTSARA